MIICKRGKDLEGVRASGHLAACVREKVAAAITPGSTTADIADYAGRLIEAEGAGCAFCGYRGFPGKICVSVNEEVVHGIPGTRVVQLGDIVSLDIGVLLGGYYGDTATSVMVGVTDPDWIRLVRTTDKALQAGIAQAVVGNHVSDISHAVQREAEAGGFSVVRDFVGHGIGRSLHEDPQVPNYGRPGKGPLLKTGMTLAIEPMVNLGRKEVEVLEDGWTVLTRDRLPSAHIEHTVAIGPDGPEILTRC